MSEPIELEHVRVLRVQPGDTVVLELADRVSTEKLSYAKSKLKYFFPDNECLVISGGSLSVARNTDPDTSPPPQDTTKAGTVEE